MNPLHQKVEDALNTIRPYLEADGGNVAVVEITSENILKLELTGACKTCNMSHMTMKAGIERIMKDRIDGVTEVVQVA